MGLWKRFSPPLSRLLVIPVIILCLILPPSALIGTAEAATVTVEVPVTTQTFSAIPGLTITAGDLLTITATGTACFDTRCSPGASPDGSNSGNGSASAKLPGAPRHALICGISGHTLSHANAWPSRFIAFLNPVGGRGGLDFSWTVFC